MLTILAILFLSYLVGSIPTSVLMGKLYGIDIRQHGSGNAGATNTFRVLGWKAGTVTLIIDFAKGWVASGLIAHLRIDPIPPTLGPFDTATLLQLIAGSMAVLGHMFPLFAGFRGGKGVATAAGALMAIVPWSMLLSITIFVLVLVLTRYVSLASIIAVISFPIILALQKYVLHAPLDSSLILFSSLLALSIIFAHRSNIQRLLQGTENRVKSFRPTKSKQPHTNLHTRHG